MSKWRTRAALCLALATLGPFFIRESQAWVYKRAGVSAKEKKMGIKALTELARSEGLTKENCYMKGVMIIGAKPKPRFTPWPYIMSGKEVRWNFNAANPDKIDTFRVTGGVRDAVIKNDKLSFTVRGIGGVEIGAMNAKQKSLNFGTIGKILSPTCYIQARIRQTGFARTWRVEYRKGKTKPLKSKDVIVKGNNWQVVTFPFGFSRWNGPPITGVKFFIADSEKTGKDTADDTIEIDWVRPCFKGGSPRYREEFDLPDKARIVKVSISAGPSFKLYVNGEIAVNETRYVDNRELWNYQLDPSLFRKGKNTIAFECDMLGGGMYTMGRWLMDGSIICADGSFHRLDTNTSWKFKQGLTGNAWIQPGYDDSSWTAVKVQRDPKDLPLSNWFNPSYKGRIMIAPADGRAQPVYGLKEPVALTLAVPCRQEKTQRLSWELFDEMGDGFRWRDTLVASGNIKLAPKDWRLTGALRLPAKKLKANTAYALVVRLYEAGKEIEKRRYELASCGPVEQPRIDNPTSYTDGMDLKLVWELNPGDELKEGSYICADLAKHACPTKVIETPLGRFRATWAENSPGGHHQGGVFMSFKYKLKNPGKAHLAIAEYPDDSVRVQEMHLAEVLPYADWSGYNGRVIGNDMVRLGIAPLSFKIRHHHCVFWPTEAEGTISFYASGMRWSKIKWNPQEHNAKVGKIRIYEITNGVPARVIKDAPGPRKWFGQCSERGVHTILTSCVNGPLSKLFALRQKQAFIPNFYRYWLMAYTNMVKRLRFAGENAIFAGMYQYGSISTPGEFSENTNLAHSGGDFNDYGVLMSKMMEENNMGWFAHMEMATFKRLRIDCSRQDLAAGKPTLGQVDGQGNTHMFIEGGMFPNYIHPEFREKYFNKVIDEWIALYGKQKGWKGIAIQLNEVLGPCWLSKHRDPYFASYDDYSIATFEKDTGIKIPAPQKGIDRFANRKKWLLANAKKAWTQWRCEKMTEVYQWVNKRLKAARPDLKLVLYNQAESYIFPRHFGVKEADWQRVQDAAARGGLDKDAIRDDKDIVLAYSIRAQHSEFVAGLGKSAKTLVKSRSQNLMSQIGNDGINGLGLRNNFVEITTYAPKGVDWPWESCKPHAYEQAPGEYFGEFWVNAFVRANPTLIALPLQDFSMVMGRETRVSRFAKAFRSLPIGKYMRLTGKGRDKNVWIEVTQYKNDVYGYIANTQNWTTTTTMTFAENLKLTDLMLDNPVSNPVWTLTLEPYTIRPFRIQSAKTDNVVLSCVATVSEAGIAATKKYLAQREAEALDAADTLKTLGKEEDVRQELEKAKTALEQGFVSLAFDTLYASPVLLWVPTIISDYKPKKANAARQKRKLTIDGEFSDWDGAKSRGVLAEKKQVLLHRKNWSGPKDCSARFQVNWDKHYLYIGLMITDDKVIFPKSEAPINYGDAVEVFIDADTREDYGDHGYNQDDTHLMLGLPVNGVGAVRLWRKRAGARDLALDGIDAAWRKTATGYNLECQIPWSILTKNTVKKAGMEIGMEVMLNDVDNMGKRDVCLIWSANKNPRPNADPTRHGKIKLIEK